MSAETDKLKGKAEKAAAELTDDRDLHRKGTVDEAAGKVKDAVDTVKDKLRSN